MVILFEWIVYESEPLFSLFRLTKPNLQPPITTTDEAMKYNSELKSIDPSVDYIMTLYLHPTITPDEVRKARKAGVAGIKSYPRGVTTGSAAGIESYEVYYHIFRVMEEVGMILNLHGEVPSCSDKVSPSRIPSPSTPPPQFTFYVQ